MSNVKTKKKKLSGWSRSKYINANIFYAHDKSDIERLIKYCTKKNIKISIRATGSSFGDQSYISKGITCDISKMNNIIDYDKSKNILIVESGITLLNIYNKILPDDYILKATPGGMQVSAGGALVNNIHGKDNFKSGNFSNNVRWIEIIDSRGRTRIIKKNHINFKHVIYSMGLFCVITKICLELVKIKSQYLEVNTYRTKNIRELISKFENEKKNENDFYIGWIDCFNKKNIGRGLLRTARFSKIKSDQNNLFKPFKINTKMFNLLPIKFIYPLISIIYMKWMFKFANSLIYHFTSLNKKILLFKNFIWIDNNFIPEYPEIFKKNGFLTLQPFFPKKNAAENIEIFLKICQKFGFEGILCPIKLHKNINSLNKLHFSGEGYSIVVDAPLRFHNKKQLDLFLKNIFHFLNEIDGKIYLTKDLFSKSVDFKKMYGNSVTDFLKIKKKFDEKDLFYSDQFQRLFK